MNRLVTSALGASACALLLVAAPAQAGESTTTAKWRNCDTRTAGISVRATFRGPAALYGTGRFMIKKWIKWEKYDAGRWLERDRSYTETSWLQINNPQYNFVSTAGDRTGWAALYYNHWRANVTIKLVKNRPGPVDKTVDTIQLLPTKGSFREVASNCGVGF